MADPLRLMVVGAHPDDADYKAGGLAALYLERGHEVLFISVTNGESGHHRISGPELVERRRAEAAEAGRRAGLTYEVWDNPDGRLVADLPRREALIRSIRRFKPDLLLTHRPNDYHPDHRQTSLMVQDAAYLLTVPPICPDVPHLRRDPVIAYLSDTFSRPYPFHPTVALDIGAAWDRKISMLDAHVSQFYEWLPYNMRIEDSVPADAAARRSGLEEWMRTGSLELAGRIRSKLVATYGPDRGASATLVEAFEGCEYGAPLDEPAIARLFPMLPTGDEVTR
ncbi:PIG-L deacetylase family protein [Isosphaeraceae bacterium EP7]